MQDTIIAVLNQYGYLGVFLLIAIENIFPPIPSEIILTFGGFLTTYTAMNAWGVVLAATVGAVLGATLLYAIGSILSVQQLENIFDSKYGKMLRLKKEDVKKSETWFLKHGSKAVLFCRCVPIVRSLISIPAGVAKMKLSTFLPLTIMGSFVWNTALVFLGRLAGNAWETIAHYVDVYSTVVLVVLVLAAVLIVVIFIKTRVGNTR